MIQIDPVLCDVCGTCVGVCPADALAIELRTLTVDMEKCIRCRACVSICPVGAVKDSDE